jgi:hypothetical protein
MTTSIKVSIEEDGKQTFCSNVTVTVPVDRDTWRKACKLVQSLLWEANEEVKNDKERLFSLCKAIGPDSPIPEEVSALMRATRMELSNG